MPKQILSREEALQLHGSPDWVAITAAHELEIDENFCEVTVPASGTYTITLPIVTQAVGKWFHFLCVSDGGGTGVVIEDQNDAFSSAFNYTSAGNGLTAVGDMIVLFCNGRCYEQHVDITT